MKRIVLALGLSAAALAIASGCANGTTEDVDPSTSDLANSPEPDAAPPPPPSETIKPADPAPASDADAGASEPTADAGAPDSGTSSDGGTTASCDAPTTCSGAADLGSVSGDTGSDTKNADGSTSKWFTIRVTENDTGPFGQPLKLTAKLTSPPGTNYDLFLYVPDGDTRECSAVSQQSTSTSGTDTASVTFGESGTFANGSADDRTVTVEVRHVSGNCDASKKWSLTLDGNQ